MYAGDADGVKPSSGCKEADRRERLRLQASPYVYVGLLVQKMNEMQMRLFCGTWTSAVLAETSRLPRTRAVRRQQMRNS
jgi:hypothetical protein